MLLASASVSIDRASSSVQVAVVDESQPLNGWRRAVVHAESSCRGHQGSESSVSVRYEMTAKRGQKVERMRGRRGGCSQLGGFCLACDKGQSRAALSRRAGLDRLTQGCDGGV